MFSIVFEILQRYFQSLGENHFFDAESKQQFMNSTIKFIIHNVENGKVD